MDCRVLVKTLQPIVTLRATRFQIQSNRSESSADTSVPPEPPQENWQLFGCGARPSTTSSKTVLGGGPGTKLRGRDGAKLPLPSAVASAVTWSC
jgi:hypothetical protein